METDCFVKVKERFERTVNANYEKTQSTHGNTNRDSEITIVTSVVEYRNTAFRQINKETVTSKRIVFTEYYKKSSIRITFKQNNRFAFRPFDPSIKDPTIVVSLF